MFPNPAVVLNATVRSDLFLLELRQRHELLLQTLGNLGEPNRTWRPEISPKIITQFSTINVNSRWNWRNLQLNSAIFGEAEDARANSIEAIGKNFSGRGRGFICVVSGLLGSTFSFFFTRKIYVFIWKYYNKLKHNKWVKIQLNLNLLGLK